MHPDMTSNPFSHDVSGPLKAELRQGCDNRTVKGGLDRFMSAKIDHELSQIPTQNQADGEYRVFLNDLRVGFGQYLAQTHEERRALIQKALSGLDFWNVRNKSNVEAPVAVVEKKPEVQLNRHDLDHLARSLPSYMRPREPRSRRRP